MFYSYLSESTGLNLAARIAGKIPKIKPIAVENDSARIIGVAVTKELKLLKDSKIQEIKYANPTPNTPPAKLSRMLSVKNWINISLFFAPRDFLIPISLVRSVTDTNIIFIIPIPPRAKERIVVIELAVSRNCVGLLTEKSLFSPGMIRCCILKMLFTSAIDSSR